MPCAIFIGECLALSDAVSEFRTDLRLARNRRVNARESGRTRNRSSKESGEPGVCELPMDRFMRASEARLGQTAFIRPPGAPPALA